MKRARTPQEKKSLSLKRDRRNAYGQNDKASRKAIPLRKALEARRVRRKADEPLARAVEGLEPAALDLAESSVRQELHRVGGWTKSPDAPLGEVIARAKVRRVRREGRRTGKVAAD